jgi:hypothetical protein
MRIVLATTCALVALAGTARAQTSVQDYIKQAMTAAPPAIAEQATIVRMQKDTMQTVRKGTNDWTCMAEDNGVPMCIDPNAMEWLHAVVTHGPVPDKTGFGYMLAGDKGSSNTDPYADAKTADNHWVVDGPHVMIFGPAVKAMVGYQRTPDPDTSKPYAMYPGSPYEHLMIPTVK